MVDLQKYIENGTVKRTDIALDIMYRNIRLEELRIILNDPVVKASFFGDGYKKKVPRNQWTKQYLDQLTCAAIADCFNPDYLYYLNEVAEYVNSVDRKNKNSKLILGVVVLAVAVAALVVVLSSINT